MEGSVIWRKFCIVNFKSMEIIDIKIIWYWIFYLVILADRKDRFFLEEGAKEFSSRLVILVEHEESCECDYTRIVYSRSCSCLDSIWTVHLAARSLQKFLQTTDTSLLIARLNIPSGLSLSAI